MCTILVSDSRLYSAAITADDCEALDKSGLRSALDALGKWRTAAHLDLTVPHFFFSTSTPAVSLFDCHCSTVYTMSASQIHLFPN